MGFRPGSGALAVCLHGAHTVPGWVLTPSWTPWVGCLNDVCIISLKGPLHSLHLDQRNQGTLGLCIVGYELLRILQREGVIQGEHVF